MPRFRYQKRIFLTPASAGSTSYILAEAESSDGGSYRNGHYMLTIADCRRKIELEFCLGTARSRKQSLAKVDLLIEVLSAFREALREEAKVIGKSGN